MIRRIGITAFVFQLVFWAAPWRVLIPATHAAQQPQIIDPDLSVNLKLAPPTPLPQALCVSQAPAGSHGITVCWTASASNTVTGYNIYTSTTAGGPYTKQNATPVAGTSFFFPTINLGGVKEFIVVRSFDSTAESANSTEITSTGIGNPLPPTAVQAVSV